MSELQMLNVTRYGLYFIPWSPAQSPVHSQRTSPQDSVQLAYIFSSLCHQNLIVYPKE